MLTLKKTPYPHQVEASHYLANGGSYLFCEPRTGKTLSTILALKSIGKRGLILAPKSVLPVWRDELALEGEDSVIIDGTANQKAKALLEPGHHIISYESSWRLIHSLHIYGVVVFDEALKLQNGETKVGRHWRELGQRYPEVIKWGLSGAPCPESPLQLANQMMVMQGQWFNTGLFNTYRWNYWDWDERKYKFKPKDPRHPKEAKGRFVDLSFRVSQKDLNMGDKVFEVRRVQASRTEESLLASNKKLAISPVDNSVDFRVEAAYRQAASSGICAEQKKVVTASNKLSEVCGAVGDYLEEEPLTQVVVMVRFVSTGKWLGEKMKCPFIYGQTSGKDREMFIREYQEGKQRVLVCQVEAVKMGLDFSADGHGILIYAEHGWSGDTFIQSTQRVVNIKRKTPALIITYCTEFKDGDCIDFNIYKAVSSKRDFNAKMLQKEK